jgi:hypothetical protein
MKILLLIAITFTAVACDSAIESKSKSCTYNDKLVDCSVLENNESKPKIDLNELPEVMKVIGQVSYKREGNKIIYSENQHFEQVFEGATIRYTCNLDFKKGDYILVKPDKNLLTITNPNQQHSATAKRVLNSAIDDQDYLLGDYDLFQIFKGQTKLGAKFTFEAYTLQMQSFCYPKIDQI